MNAPPPPLRFLLLVVGGWVAVRAVTLLPGAPAIVANIPVAEAAAASQVERAEPHVHTAPPMFPKPDRHLGVSPVAPRPHGSFRDFAMTEAPSRRLPGAFPAGRGSAPAGRPAASFAWQASVAPQPLAQAQAAALPPFVSAPPESSRSRWAGSAWLFVRDDGDRGALAPGGTLGGSQAGLRLTYRLNSDARQPISLSARLYSPLDSPRGAEAALGIDWRPIASLPVHILAERRQAIGRDGRSDFALMAHGGTETHVAGGRVRIEGYGQAGVVGVEEGDLFADGAVVATTRAGPVDLGGGAWGGAQEGASRLDIGPHASFRLPVGRVTIRASAEWRFRIAGDAAPGSGPVLTISAGF